MTVRVSTPGSATRFHALIGRSVGELVARVMGVVVGLSFLFGFGNVWALAVRLGVTAWVAPLVAPAVDLTVVGLMVAIHRLAAVGMAPEVIRAARRLLALASTVTLVLNIAEPVILAVRQGGVRRCGTAAVDRVGRGRPRSSGSAGSSGRTRER